MEDRILPDGFQNLIPFLDNWSLGTTAERTAMRHRSTIIEIQSFYDAVFPQAVAALSYLSVLPYDCELSVADRNLMNLFLSLAEIATAVEWYGQPAVIDGYEPLLVRMPVELP